LAIDVAQLLEQFGIGKFQSRFSFWRSQFFRFPYSLTGQTAVVASTGYPELTVRPKAVQNRTN
jgi:hypothetical protein